MVPTIGIEKKIQTGDGPDLGVEMNSVYLRMSTDILLEDVRTSKLRRRLGDGSVYNLLKIWAWAARYCPDGQLLEIDSDDIEQIGEWRERMTGKLIDGHEAGVLTATLMEVGFLVHESGVFRLPDLGNGNIIIVENP